MTSTTNGRLVGTELLEHYAKHKEGDAAEMIQAAGYRDPDAFVSMMQRALGTWPLPISKDPDVGQEWRSANSTMSMSAPFYISFQRNNNPDSAEAIAKVVSHFRDEYKSSVHTAGKYKKAYLHSYLRNFTHAYYEAQCQGTYTYDKFLEVFKSDIFAYGDMVLREMLTSEEVSDQLKAGAEFDDYMQLTAHIFTNYFANMIYENQLDVVEESSDMFQRWLKLHHQYEQNKALDELHVIKVQLLNSFTASAGSIAMDDEKRTQFINKAYAFMDKFNLKISAKRSISEEKLAGLELLEIAYGDKGAADISSSMNDCGYDDSNEDEIKEYWAAFMAAEAEFEAIVDKLKSIPDEPLTGQELVDRFKDCSAASGLYILIAVRTGYFEKTASGHINVFIKKMIEAFKAACIELGIMDHDAPEEQLKTWAENAPKSPYKGDELLKRVKDLGDVSKSELVTATGYFSYREDGTIRLHFTEFYENLLTAKGIQLQAAKNIPNNVTTEPLQQATDQSRVTAPLTGEALLARVKELGEITKTDLVIGCGYVSIDEDGSKRPLTTDFYEALLTAEGNKLGGSQQTLINGLDYDQLIYKLAGDINLKQYGSDQPLVSKYVILHQLQWSIKYREFIAEELETHGELKSAQFWRRDASYLKTAKEHVMNVYFGEKDELYSTQVPEDGFLFSLSSESLEVLEHFGNEAPALLNKYSTAVEDALIDQVKENTELRKELAALKGEAYDEEQVNVNQQALARAKRDLTGK